MCGVYVYVCVCTLARIIAVWIKTGLASPRQVRSHLVRLPWKLLTRYLATGCRRIERRALPGFASIASVSSQPPQHRSSAVAASNFTRISGVIPSVSSFFTFHRLRPALFVWNSPFRFMISVWRHRLHRHWWRHIVRSYWWYIAHYIDDVILCIYMNDVIVNINIDDVVACIHIDDVIVCVHWWRHRDKNSLYTRFHVPIP